MVINLAVFALQLLIPSVNDVIALQPQGSQNFNIFQYLTACFAHGGFLHILFNMFALVSFGPQLERRFGSNKFLYFYLVTGVLANIFWHYISNPIVPALGASGALFGVLAVFTILNPETKLSIIFLPFFGFKAKWLFGIVLLVELVLVIMGTQDGIGHVVHISGAIIGTIYYVLFLKGKSGSVHKRAGVGINAMRKRQGK